MVLSDSRVNALLKRKHELVRLGAEAHKEDIYEIAEQISRINQEVLSNMREDIVKAENFIAKPKSYNSKQLKVLYKKLMNNYRECKEMAVIFSELKKDMRGVMK